MEEIQGESSFALTCGVITGDKIMDEEWCCPSNDPEVTRCQIPLISKAMWIALLTVNFSPLHNNVIQRWREAISG